VPDINTPEDVRKALGELSEGINTLKAAQESERGDTKQLVSRMGEDIRKLDTAITAMRAGGSQDVGTDERGLRKYMDQEGTAARMLPGTIRATKQHAPGLLTDAPTCEWQKDLQREVTSLNIVSTLRGGISNCPTSVARMAAVLQRAPANIRGTKQVQDLTKAFVDSSGVGAEWIIDAGLPEVAMDPLLVGQVAAQFRVKPMNDGTELLPYESNGLRPYKKAAATSDDPAQFSSSSIATAQRTITASGMVVRAQVDEDAAEDSILAAMPFLQSELVLALNHGEEDCLLNGDTAGTHQDTGIASWNIRSRWGATGLGGSADHRRTYIGLRARSTDVSSASDGGSAQTYAGATALLATLAFGGGVGPNAFFVTSAEYMLVKMLTWAEFQGVNVVGALASQLTGQVLMVAGKPVLLSSFMDIQLNATGVYDNTTKTKTGLLAVDGSRHWITERKGNMVEVDKDITRGMYNLVAKNRRGFFTPDASTTKNVAFSYNLSPS
jgi:hypothetical protein